MAENEDLIVLDSSDPLNLIINNAAMDDSDPNATSPDWSQLGALWPEEPASGSTSSSTGNSKQFSEYIDFNMASSMLDMDLDMSLSGSGIEPSALHLGASDRLGYPSFDDAFQFTSSASPADILAAQFPFTFNGGDVLMNFSSSNMGLETPNTKPRRLSVTSSSSSSGPSYSPLPESIPSPEYLSPGGGYTSDSTHNSSAASFANSETFDQSFTEQPAITTKNAVQPSQPTPATTNSDSLHAPAAADCSGDPAAELAQRVRQSAGVLLAVPMNGNGAPFQVGQSFPTASALQTKLPIPRLQRPAPATPPKLNTPSATSSAASTPPPSTPPSTSASPNDSSSASTLPSTASPIAQSANLIRPKTSHTTIERRYRTNLNARIQSLRMAVPALRVLEDRDSGGSSKKIKKNLKTGVLIKSANGATPHGGAACANGGAPLNPYGEVDVIDERGYVDGVKVARKCSKANVLGKAVEYIRVLKRRELRLRAEQDGLKALVCGLVGGPALLREWELEWRERFGGEERDEVPLDGGEGDDEGDDEDEDDDDDDDGEGAGKKRKRVKVEKDLPLPKKEPKPASNTALNIDGQPEKRKRGRPRKIPLPVPTVSSQPTASTATAPVVQETQQQPQQYLLAVFALFSFFNSPLTSNSRHTTHQSHGHVLSPPPVPLAYAPEIVSQFNPPAGLSVATVTWRDWVQIAHLAITVLLFISVLTRIGGVLGLTQLRKLVKGDSMGSNKEDAQKKIEMIILGRDAVPSFTSALTLYRSLPSLTSPITCALYLYTLASCSSTPALARPVLRARARAIWSSSPRIEKKDHVILSSTIEDVYAALPGVAPIKSLNIVHAIAECLVKKKLGDTLGRWFIREVNSSNSKDKAVAVEPSENLSSLLEAAEDLGGEVAVLGRNIERIKALHSETTSATNTVPVVWKAVVPGDSVSEEDSDDSDISSLSASIDSLDNYVAEDDEEESQVPSTILHALVLYRSLFSVSSSTPTIPNIGLGLLAPPPMISVEPPTPTTPTPVRRRTATLSSTTLSTTSSPAIAAATITSLSSAEQQKKMHVLRKLLGSRAFERYGEVMEDARDRVVDMLVDAERQSLRARV